MLRCLFLLAASTSAHVLRSSGILPAWQHAWHKATHFSLEGYRSVFPALGSTATERCEVANAAQSDFCREPFLLGKRSPGAPGSAFPLSS